MDRGLRCVVLTLIFAALGCEDLSQVTTFSSTAKQAESALTALVQDLQASCERFNHYAPLGSPQRDCSQYEKQGQGITAAQAVLLNYMQALGQLSSDKAVTFSQGTTDLANQLQGAGLDGSASKAATGLVGKLADAITNGYRRKKIAEVVSAENGNVQTLTTALATIIGQDYKSILGNESTAMDSYYKRALQYQDKEPLAATVVQRQWHDAEDTLKAKMMAADAYAKIMTSIADGHQKLSDQGKSLKTKDLFQTLGKDVGDITNSVNDVYKAFK